MRILKPILLSLFLLPYFSFAQESDWKKVPQSIRNKFDSAFPNARNVRWQVINVPKIPYKSKSGVVFIFQPYSAYFKINYLSSFLPDNYKANETVWTKKGLDELKLLYENSYSAKLDSNYKGYYLIKRPPFIHSIADSEAYCNVHIDSSGNIKAVYITIIDSSINYPFSVDSSHSVIWTNFSIQGNVKYTSQKYGEIISSTEVYVANFDSASIYFSSKNKYKYNIIKISDPTQVPIKISEYIKQHYPSRCRLSAVNLHLDQEEISTINVILKTKSRRATVTFDKNCVVIKPGRLKFQFGEF